MKNTLFWDIYLVARVYTAPTLLSLAGSLLQVWTFPFSGPSQPELHHGWSSSSFPVSKEHTALIFYISYRPEKNAPYLHQLSVSCLFRCPPGLSLQSIHIVQWSLPHGGKMAVFVTHLVPVIGLDQHTINSRLLLFICITYKLRHFKCSLRWSTCNFWCFRFNSRFFKNVNSGMVPVISHVSGAILIFYV